VYKTSVYTLVNGNMKELAHWKQQKLQKAILPASHWLCEIWYLALEINITYVMICNFPVLPSHTVCVYLLLYLQWCFYWCCYSWFTLC